jgi:outer membrane protein assembly factor BamB
VPDGTLIGEYTVHYADGDQAVIPIEYGKDVRDYNDHGDSRSMTRGKVVWIGTNAAGNRVRLYVSTWENPSPAKTVASIDYYSMNTVCSPVCIAMSGEPVPKEKEGQTQAAVIAWRFQDSVGLSGPVVVDDLVLVGNDQGLLRAFRTKDGTQVWSHKHEERIYDAPTCDSNHVYFSSARGVVAVARKDGKMQWNIPFPQGAGVCLVLEQKGLVFAGGNDGFIYALDAQNGAIQWKTNIVDDAPPDPPDFPSRRARSAAAGARPTGVACDGETVYQSLFDQSRVVGIDALTGKMRWSYQTGGWIYGAPAVSAEHLLVASQNKLLHCVDKKTGKLLWKFATGSRNEATPVIEQQSVFFGSCDGGLYRVNLADGKRIWKFDTEPDYTGRRPIYSMPILTHDTVYLAAMEGHVYALDKKTGRLKWKLRASEFSEIEHGPATDGRHLFVVTRPDWDKRGESSLVAITLK